MAEGVHFTWGTPAGDVGRKLLRVNLSDLAAMGAAPCAYTLVAALPPDLGDDWIEGFASGLREDQERYRVRLIGGDTVAAGRLVLSLTMLGTVRRGAELRRSGARPGDTVYVSGAVGDAGLGLRAGRGEFPTLDAGARAALRARLDRPSPRLKLGRALPALATAAIDVSDGLVADLARLCAASGPGRRSAWATFPLPPLLARPLPRIQPRMPPGSARGTTTSSCSRRRRAGRGRWRRCRGGSDCRSRYRRGVARRRRACARHRRPRSSRAPRRLHALPGQDMKTKRARPPAHHAALMNSPRTARCQTCA